MAAETGSAAARQGERPAPGRLCANRVGAIHSGPTPDRCHQRKGKGAGAILPSLGLGLPSASKYPLPNLRADEKAAFEKEFVERLKPAVERWCKTYAGHVPFRLEDVTPDKFRERFGDSPAFYDYGFVINGTTLSVVDYHGEVFVAYLMSPAAALLFQVPNNPEPPKPVSVTREDVLRLLKADSGQDFPPEQIAWRPTAYAGAMNGGVSVDVGEGVNAATRPLPEILDGLRAGRQSGLLLQEDNQVTNVRKRELRLMPYPARRHNHSRPITDA